MAQPPSLRVRETVIEEFGVSRKYVVLLSIIGGGLILGGILLAFGDEPLIDIVAQGAGPLAPLIFLLVEFAIVGFGAFVLIRAFYLAVAYRYFLTNERVMETVGFLAQRTVSVDYREITDIVVRQDVINRLILNTGTLTANTPGGPGEELIFMNIDNPQARREQLRSLSEASMGGRKIDQHYLAWLKVRTGMERDVGQAEKELERDMAASIPGESRNVSDEPPQAPSAESQAPVASQQSASPTDESVVVSEPLNPVSPTPTPSPDQDVEDFNQDGRIDESERLRSAQKRMQAPNE